MIYTRDRVNNKSVIKMKNEGKTRKRSRRKDTRPQEIIQAAVEVFISRGFGATTFEDIASAGDFSRSTIYLYFKSKEEILRAYVHNLVEEHLQRLATAGISDNSKTQEEKIRLLLSVIEQFFSDQKSVGIILLLLTESPVNNSLAGIWVENILGTIRRNWEEITGTNLSEDKESDVSFRALVSPFLTMAMMNRIIPDNLSSMTAHDLTLLLPDMVRIKNKREDILQ